MRTTNQLKNTKPKNGNPNEVYSPISWRHLGAVGVLGLLSLISEWQVFPNLKISGGATLVALAAVILLWPVVQQIAARGGEIDLKGLRLKVNRIESEAQRVENDNALRIQELEAELDDLRTQSATAARENEGSAKAESQAIRNDVSVLEWAVTSYRNAAQLREFRTRVEIDKGIVLRGRHLSYSALRDFLESQSWSPEAQMAVAVALGLPPRNDEEAERARLLADLMRSGHERVRARSGQAAKRWGERRTAKKECRSLLLKAVEERLLEESPTSGALAYLEKAQEILSATLELGNPSHRG